MIFQVIITNHAMQRMIDRGCNPKEVISFMRESIELILVKNHRGYEINVPFKGRLVGDLDQGTFIVKSFLLPSRFGRDYYVNGVKSSGGFTVQVSSISLPRCACNLYRYGGEVWHGLRDAVEG